VLAAENVEHFEQDETRANHCDELENVAEGHALSVGGGGGGFLLDFPPTFPLMGPPDVAAIASTRGQAGAAEGVGYRPLHQGTGVRSSR
jgi:hypothetical protein